MENFYESDLFYTLAIIAALIAILSIGYLKYVVRNDGTLKVKQLKSDVKEKTEEEKKLEAAEKAALESWKTWRKK